MPLCVRLPCTASQHAEPHARALQPRMRQQLSERTQFSALLRVVERCTSSQMQMHCPLRSAQGRVHAMRASRQAHQQTRLYTIFRLWLSSIEDTCMQYHRL